ncbi:MAG: hypothetical protein ABR535_01535, partial [Pyrinomonadaceae bacterium]
MKVKYAFDIIEIDSRFCGRLIGLPFDSMLRRYMHRRERHFAMLNDNRVVRPFEWGTEFIDAGADGVDPRTVFEGFSRKTLADSEAFFSIPEITDYKLYGRELTWPSSIETPSLENNIAYATYF